MKGTKPQFARLLELDRQIRLGKYPNCSSFAVAWEVSQKTVQRDIDFLRDIHNAPIEYDRERKGFYYTDKSWFLPALQLSEGELFAVLLGASVMDAYRGTPIAQDLDCLYRRLAGLLPDKVHVSPETLAGRFSFTSPPVKRIDADIWTTVVRATQAQRILRIRYKGSGAKESSERKINPCHVANLQGEWYVFVYDEEKDRYLQYAIARIQKAVMLESSFALPENFDPKSLLANVFGRYAGSREVHSIRLLFAPDVVEWVLEREWHPKQEIKKLQDGSVELSFPAVGLYEVFRWVMGWGHSVKVLAPDGLRKQVADEVRLMSGQTG